MKRILVFLVVGLGAVTGATLAGRMQAPAPAAAPASPPQGEGRGGGGGARLNASIQPTRRTSATAFRSTNSSAMR